MRSDDRQAAPIPLAAAGLAKIVSGGQTGVDRAALDVALEAGLPCGGWCPRGRRAADGPLPARYPLRETASARYEERTERNVLDSDATLILAHEPLRGGTALTERIRRKAKRPGLVCDPTDAALARKVALWIERHAIRTLNIAGPRETDGSVYATASRFLRLVLEPSLASPERGSATPGKRSK